MNPYNQYAVEKCKESYFISKLFFFHKLIIQQNYGGVNFARHEQFEMIYRRIPAVLARKEILL